jgi:hypothetical protein
MIWVEYGSRPLLQATTTQRTTAETRTADIFLVIVLLSFWPKGRLLCSEIAAIEINEPETKSKLLLPLISDPFRFFKEQNTGERRTKLGLHCTPFHAFVNPVILQKFSELCS